MRRGYEFNLKNIEKMNNEKIFQQLLHFDYNIYDDIKLIININLIDKI